jgi:diadenosine tetraphosphate (Ap4A) HIT family hydrolase
MSEPTTSDNVAISSDVLGCIACDLTHQRKHVPGGRIYATDNWVIEHCVGPLPVGTLILKPVRHTLHVSDLTNSEASELGQLLQLTSKCIQTLTSCNQVYNCLWSHGKGVPSHVHYIVQPAWPDDHERYGGSGPAVQVAQFRELGTPDIRAVGEFSERARAWFAQHQV